MARCSRWTDRSVQRTGEPLCVLIVDDNVSVGTALAEVLRHSVMEARYAPSAPKALELTRDWTPDVVVLDINMPEHDGFTTARILRRLVSMRHTALVAFTSMDEHDVRARATAAGFDGYCQKGQSPESLIKLIQTVAANGQPGH